MPTESQKDAKLISVSRFDPGFFHVRRVVCGLMVVVLQDLEDLIDLHSRNENDAFPVVNHSAGDIWFFTGRLSTESTRLNLPAFQSARGRQAVLLRQSIDPKERTLAEAFGILRLGLNDVLPKRHDRRLSERE